MSDDGFAATCPSSLRSPEPVPVSAHSGNGQAYDALIRRAALALDAEDSSREALTQAEDALEKAQREARQAWGALRDWQDAQVMAARFRDRDGAEGIARGEPHE